MEWHKSYFLSVHGILQLLESTGDTTLFNAIQSFILARYNWRITHQCAKQEDPKVIKQWFEVVQGTIQGNHEWVTIIGFVSTKGIHIPPAVILKGKEHQAAWYQESNLHPDWKLTNSVNGWTTDKIGLAWLECLFDPFSKLHSTGAK